jgi:hypothetical protein
MKELIEGLLFVALLKFLGAPLWLIRLGSILFLIVFLFYSCLAAFDSRIQARKLAANAARKKQQAEEIKEAERTRQEAIADAEWNARFV